MTIKLSNFNIVWMMVFVVSLLAAVPVLAQENKEEEARTVVKQAYDAFAAGDYQNAAQLFRKTSELRPSWKLYYNIGQAEAAAKRYGLALEAFETYLAEGGDRVEVQRGEEVMKEITRLRLLVGTVELEAPDGTELYIEGMLRGTAPLRSTVQVGVGTKEVRLVLNGEEILKDAFPFRGGAPTKIAVESTPTADSSDAADDNVRTEIEVNDNTVDTSRPKPWTPLRISGWSLVGAGGAALIGGIITGGIVVSRKSALSKDCENDICTDPGDKDKIDDTKALGNVSTVLTIAGGVLAASGVVLLVLNKKKHQESVALKVSPLLSKNLQGIFLQGEF
ncbi:MAG: tetratricopeptide repeat protein [Deltaproteobacteria bacterium]|nr:tetratricopeptide repeat protein [Deltaproteobacteria bacterium]